MPLAPSSSIAKAVSVALSALTKLRVCAATAFISLAIGGANAAVVFSDDFNGTALDAGKWTEYRWGTDVVTVAGSTAHFASKTAATTCGKHTFAGTGGIVVESRMAGPGGLRDTHMELIEVNSGDWVQAGDTNYNDHGLYTYGAGQFSRGQGGSGGTTNAMMEYRMTLNGTLFKIERGPTLANITQTRTITLPVSASGKTFFLRIGTGGPDYQPGDFEWVRVDATAGAVNSNCNASGGVTPVPTYTLTIPANAYPGVNFTNPLGNTPATCAITATGTWDNGPTASYGPDGAYLLPVCGIGCRLPTAPSVSLVMMRGNGSGQLIGSSRSVALAGSEAVTFSNNDFVTAYADNRGSVAVTISCVVPAVNGICGTADKVAVTTAPTTNLCTTGAANPTTPTGPGPWSWTCNGSGGGTNASCSAISSAILPPFFLRPDQLVYRVGARDVEGLPVVDSTELIHLPLAAALRPLTKATLVCTSSNPAVAALSGTKQYPLDNFEVVGAVAEARSLGTTTITCGAVSQVLTVANPQVSSIVPDAPYLGAPVRFKVIGNGLQPNMRFQVAGCAGDTIEFNATAGSSIERTFVCTPTVPASQGNAFRVRLVNSKVNIAPNASFEPISDDGACSTSAERYARLLSQYGNKTDSSSGAKYGEIPFLAMSWDDLKTFTVARRAPGVNLCRDETPSDIAEERDRSLAMWRDRIASELDKIPPTYAGGFKAAWVNTKPSDLAKHGVNIALGTIGVAKGFTALRAISNQSKRMKGMSRVWRVTKNATGIGLTGKSKLQFEAFERLVDYIDTAQSASTIAFDVLALSEADRVELRNAVIDLDADLFTYGVEVAHPFTSLRDFLDNKISLTESVGEDVLKLGITLMAKFAGNQSLSLTERQQYDMLWELGSMIGARFPIPIGLAANVAKELRAFLLDGFDAAFESFETAQLQYSSSTQEVVRSNWAESLQVQFAKASEANRHIVPLVSRVDFGGVQADATETLRVNLTNPSSATWRIRDINFDATGYSLVSNGCLIIVAPTGACHLVLRFSPVARAAYSDSLVLDYLIDDLPYRTRIPVIGVGLAKRSATLVKTINLAAPNNAAATIALRLVNPTGVDTGCTIDRARVITANDALFSSSSLLSTVTTQRVPYGFVDFKLSGCNLGATQTIRIEYPAALPPPEIVKMWKRWDNGSTVETLQFGSPGLPFNFTILGNVLTYTVTDGGPGDMDRTMNGVILDPAGVSFNCSLAVSGGIQPTAAGDGVLLLRYLMGFRGAALTAGLTLGSRNTPEAIAAFLGSAVQYDPLGRAPAGGPVATVEGIVLMRLMLGLPDAALLSGISVPDSAQFKTGFDVRANVNSLCGTTY